MPIVAPPEPVTVMSAVRPVRSVRPAAASTLFSLALASALTLALTGPWALARAVVRCSTPLVLASALTLALALVVVVGSSVVAWSALFSLARSIARSDAFTVAWLFIRPMSRMVEP